MSAGTISPSDPLILRLLLRAIRPNTVQVNVHRWVALVAVTPYCYILWGRAYFTDWRVFGGASLVMYTLAVLSTAASSYLTEQTYQRYPDPWQAGQRLRIISLLMALMGLGTTAACLWVFDAVQLFGYRYDPATGPWILGSALVLDLLLAGLFEVTFAFGQWQANQLEAEQLVHRQLQGQLDDVKQQVNPHFLFNSLNSLSVLIGENPPQAERFVDEMAAVYRYLLRAHRVSQLPALARLISLDAELRFIESYAYLLRTRYGAALELHLADPAAYPPGSLLPLTLQLLVDNAIRHNVLSATRPLRIEIQPGAGGVRVQNTLQRRSVRVPMTRDGLASLQARYHLLGPAHTLQVTARDGQFCVLVPLVAA